MHRRPEQGPAAGRHPPERREGQRSAGQWRARDRHSTPENRKRPAGRGLASLPQGVDRCHPVHRSTPILDRLRDHQPACYPADPQLKIPVKMRLPTWDR